MTILFIPLKLCGRFELSNLTKSIRYRVNTNNINTKKINKCCTKCNEKKSLHYEQLPKSILKTYSPIDTRHPMGYQGILLKSVYM